MNRLPALLFSLLAVPLPALAGVQPGKWELTVEVSLSQLSYTPNRGAKL
jgi:hypothetical protein